MAKKLTDLAVKRLKADPNKRLEVPDADVRGLYLVVQTSGVKSWCYRYRFGGRPCKLTLGGFVDEKGEDNAEPELGRALTLADARLLARNAANDLARGVDPAERKRALKAAAVSAPKHDGDSFAALVEKFEARHLKGLREGVEYKRLLDTLVMPQWGSKRIQDIRKKDVIDLLDGLKDRGMTGGANKVFAVVRKFFNWCVGRDIIHASPCAGVEPPADIKSRDRVLSDEELRWFWQACGMLGFPFGPVGKLLLLTGQRLREVSEMTTGEINGLWTIPAERAKNGKAHDVPLSAAALRVLEDLPRIHSKAGFLFTTTGESAVSGFSRFKRNLDAAMLEIAREETGNEALEIPQWWLHDLRRSTASGMARLGINLPVIEKVLNHVSGSFAGIVGVYQRHNFAGEKRTALETWGRFVMSLVEEQTAGNVLVLRAS
jgi:integrase